MKPPLIVTGSIQAPDASYWQQRFFEEQDRAERLQQELHALRVRTSSTKIQALRKATLGSSAACQRIMAHLEANPGASRDDIAAALGLKLSTVCGRVADLKKAGKVKPQGTKTNAGGSVVERLWVIG